MSDIAKNIGKMGKYVVSLVLIASLFSCKEETSISSANPVNWKKRSIELSRSDTSLLFGRSYLSVYPEIYSITEDKTLQLTVTVSMRNMNATDSVFILSSEYYDTHGDLIRTYFDTPIFVKPMETVEIIIDRDDKAGGTGANFIFEWATQGKAIAPLFESVMISTSGQQGISFTTQGIELAK